MTFSYTWRVAFSLRVQLKCTFKVKHFWWREKRCDNCSCIYPCKFCLKHDFGFGNFYPSSLFFLEGLDHLYWVFLQGLVDILTSSLVFYFIIFFFLATENIGCPKAKTDFKICTHLTTPPSYFFFFFRLLIFFCLA